MAYTAEPVAHPAEARVTAAPVRAALQYR